MKSLKSRLINENWSDGKLDKSVKAPEKKKIQNAIYKKLEETRSTGGYFHDQNWEGVKKVTKDVGDALDELSKKLDGFKYDVSIAPDEGGYRKSKDGLSQWKQYKVEIYKVPDKYEDYPEPFMMGTLNCHAAGTQEDPFSTYDMSFCIGY